VFAYNVSTKADERDLFEFFSKAGTVLDVRIIYDRNTPRSKGMAYIEMGKREDVNAALALTGTALRGQMVMVKHSEAEKNIAWEAERAAKNAGGATLMLPTTGASGMPGSGQPGTLRVSGLHPSLTDGDVRAVFEPFGPIISVILTPGGVVGDADVTYASGTTAVAAMQQLNGLDLAGTALRVTLAPGVMMAQGATNGAALGAGSAMPAAPALAPVSAAELDDEGEGIKLDSRSRAALMAKLAGNAGQAMVTAIDPRTGLPVTAAAAHAMAAAAGPSLPQTALPTTQGRLGPSSPIATECLLLKNMFDPATETDPDWWIDIGQDVKEECSKYGPVRHVFVDRNSPGFVYLKFNTVASCAAAKQALHMRWFASRMIAAEFQFVALYNKEWSEAI